RADRSGHRVRDVVKLEIQKDAIAATHELLDEPRTMTREQAAADLEAADQSPQPVREFPRIVHRVDIECDEQLIHLSLASRHDLVAGIDGPHQIRDASDVVTFEILLNAVEKLAPDQRIDEVRGADLYGVGAGDHEFDGVFGVGYAAHP